jgi:hypothetical protein
MISALTSMLQFHVVFAAFLFPLLVQLLGIGLVLLLIAGLLAPFESLGWWAGWFGHADQDLDMTLALEQEPAEREASEEVEHYLVYLSGIGVIAGDALGASEVGFLDALRARIPGVVLVDDVFPYAMNNCGLTGQRTFASLWRWIRQRNLKGKGGILAMFINARNVFQVMVSADRRYGPIYNFGISKVILQHLLGQGYRLGSGKRVTLIGFSGGGQISIGAAAYLQPVLEAPLRVVSIGGVMADDPGLNQVEHLSHLYGTKDSIQKVGQMAYAGRWPLLPHSPWNRAKADHKITLIPLGPIGHTGHGGYFDPASHLEDGRSFLEQTVEAVAQAIGSGRNDAVAAVEQQAIQGQQGSSQMIDQHE